jgi:hypothetical protein
MRVPGDNTFVDADRRVVRDWRNFLLRLQAASDLSDSDVATLKLLIAGSDAILNQEEDEAAGFSFGQVDAFNQTVAADGGSVTAASAADTLSIDMEGSGHIRTNQSSNALSIAVGGSSALIPGTGLIAPIGYFEASDQTIDQNIIYALPIVVPSLRSFTEIVWSRSGAGTPNWSGGVYADYNGAPGQRLAATGTLAVPAPAGLVSGAISITLPGGPYWLLFTISGSLTAKCIRNDFGTAKNVTRDAAFTAIIAWERAAAFDGTLPDETGSVWTASTANDNPVVTLG